MDPRRAAVEEGLMLAVQVRGMEPARFTILERMEHYHVPGLSVAVLDEGPPRHPRHILTHTGGLTVHGFPGYALGAPLANPIQVLRGAGPANTDAIRVDTIPGSLWRYSGGGYTVLQQLLEDVTGTPFPVLMRELVLDPAEMPLSSYAQPLPPGRARYAASAHLSDGSPGDGTRHVYPEMAAAGLWTNPTELAQLALEVQAAYAGEAGRVLSPEMTREQLTAGPGGWGLGFAIQGEGPTARFVHGGSNYGFRAQFLAFFQGGRGAFVMTNGEGGSVLGDHPGRCPGVRVGGTDLR